MAEGYTLCEHGINIEFICTLCESTSTSQTQGFKQTSKVVSQILEKRTIYSGDQYIHMRVQSTNGEHFQINVTGSQQIKIDTSVTRKCLEALVADLNLLLEGDL